MPIARSCFEKLKRTRAFSPILFLQGIRRSIAVGIPPVVGDHIDVRVSTAVLRVGCADFEYSGGRARFVYQMMTIGIATPERRAISGAQNFFAGVGDQRQLAIEHPDEFVLMAMPMTLAGPSPRLDNRHVYAELGQPGMPRQPLAGLSDAGLIEGTWIGAA